MRAFPGSTPAVGRRLSLSPPTDVLVRKTPLGVDSSKFLDRLPAPFEMDAKGLSGSELPSGDEQAGYLFMTDERRSACETRGAGKEMGMWCEKREQARREAPEQND